MHVRFRPFQGLLSQGPQSVVRRSSAQTGIPSIWVSLVAGCRGSLR